jgi:hypothetical protein
MSAERKEHEPREMKIEVIVGDQYRARCEKCKAIVVITPEQSRSGIAMCYGQHISVAWNPFADRELETSRPRSLQTSSAFDQV